MTPHFKYFLAGLALVFLAGCDTTLTILDGSDYACGQIHVEGYVTDTQGEVRVGKIPEGWTAEDFLQVCPQ